MSIETTTQKMLTTGKERATVPVRSVTRTPEIPPPSHADKRLALLAAKADLTQIDQLEFVFPKPAGPTRYSTLFFRVLLVSAIGLTLLGMSQSQNEPTPVSSIPEVSTGELQINPQTDRTSVDDLPPDIFVQPSE